MIEIRTSKFLFAFISCLLIILFLSNSSRAWHFNIEAPTEDLKRRTELALNQSEAELRRLLGRSFEDTLRVFIAEDRYDFDTAAFGHLPDWGVGVAIPSRNYISVLSPIKENFRLPFEEVLRHELAHIALHKRVDGNPVPRFLNEGFAMMFAHQWSFSDDLTLAKASFTASTMTLKEIDYVNLLNPSQAQIAYSQSYQAVKFFIDTFGTEAFHKLLDGFKNGLDYDRAFRSVIGSDFASFDNLFAKHLNKHYHWIMIFTDPWLLWIGLALILILGFLLIRKRRKDIYKKWEEEEKYQSTDFDYEESSPWD